MMVLSLNAPREGRRAASYRGPRRPIGGNPELPGRIRSAVGQILAHLCRLSLVPEFGEDRQRLGPGMAGLRSLAVFRLGRPERAQRDGLPVPVSRGPVTAQGPLQAVQRLLAAAQG